MDYFNFISVGIDVASKISWGCIMTPNHKQSRGYIKIDHNDIASLQYLVSEIKKAEEEYSMKARVFLESTGIYHIPLFYHLKESGFEVDILNPLVTNSNKNCNIRKVKSDKTDSKRIAKLAYTDDLKVSLVPDDVILNIRALTRDYHRLVDNKTAYINQLTKDLMQVFPGYSAIFSNTVGKTSKAILKKYGTPKAILGSPKNELIELIIKISKKGKPYAQTCYEKLEDAAKIALTFSHQLDSSYYLIDMKIDMIEIIEEKVEAIQQQIELLLTQNNGEEVSTQVKLIESIPGVGFITAITLIAEIGNIKCFKKPKHLVAYFGIDPSVNESGNFKGTHAKMSKRGSRMARRVLFQIAVASVRKDKAGKITNPVIRAYYKNKLESKVKKVALGAIMKKITNIIFAVLRDRKEFELKTNEEHRFQYNNKDLQKVA